MKNSLPVGIVGAAHRGTVLAQLLNLTDYFSVRAVCDADVASLPDMQRASGAALAFSSYEEMLSHGDVKAVILATPIPLHAEMAIAALERGLHVLSEVSAAVTIDECRRLTEAAERSTGIYMMGENYPFRRENQIIKELVKKGLFGETYYAEAEYLHELKDFFETTPWRLRCLAGINGITYGTHSLGPLLQWMPGQRIVSVCCVGSGHHYRDSQGNPYPAEDTCVMLAKTDRGGLLKIRVDMLSDRPHAMTNYSLQGTDGAYESARSPDEPHRVWLRSRHPRPDIWEDLQDLNHTPDLWRHDALLKNSDHGGGDLLVLQHWRDVIEGKVTNELGIHEAMDMTLPGIISQESIAQGGGWLPVPDSRDWKKSDVLPPAPLQMIWPVDRPAPDITLSADYQLGLLHDGEEDSFITLMQRAGFDSWNADFLGAVRRTILPKGLLVVRHRETGQLVATANANHCPDLSLHPEGGELGWVAADPDHAGKGLGRTVCAAVIRRFHEAGYQRIYLRTDDHRLAAIKSYLQLGFEPLLYRDDMESRWNAIKAKLTAAARR